MENIKTFTNIWFCSEKVYQLGSQQMTRLKDKNYVTLLNAIFLFALKNSFPIVFQQFDVNTFKSEFLSDGSSSSLLFSSPIPPSNFGEESSKAGVHSFSTFLYVCLSYGDKMFCSSDLYHYKYQIKDDNHKIAYPLKQLKKVL